MRKQSNICVEMSVSPEDGPLFFRLLEFPKGKGRRERAQYAKSLLIQAYAILEQRQMLGVPMAQSTVAPVVDDFIFDKHIF